VLVCGPNDLRRQHTPEAVTAVEAFITGLDILSVWFHKIGAMCVLCWARKRRIVDDSASETSPRMRGVMGSVTRTMVMSRPARAELTPECCAAQSLDKSDSRFGKQRLFFLLLLT